MRRPAQYLLGSFAILMLVAMAGAMIVVRTKHDTSTSAPSASASASVVDVPPPPMPFPADRVDLVPERRLGLVGIRPARDERPAERGTVWATPSGRGFGRHVARSLHLLADPAWLLVQADSGLWLLEAQTLARRARLRTGALSAVAVSADGRRIAYAESTPRPAPDSPSEADKQAELVVLEFPSLVEVHRSRVVKPAQIRFSHDARAVAAAAGNGATVIPLDGGGAPWTAKRAPSKDSEAIAVVPLDASRVAYLTSSAALVVQDRDAERFEHRYPRKSTDLIFFRLMYAWSGGLLYHDAARDRVLSVRDTEALVVDAASTESPRLGNPIDIAAGPVDAMRPYVFMPLQDLAKRFDVAPDVPVPSDPVFAALGTRDDAYFIWSEHVVRLGRGLASRSPDFSSIDEDWEPSLTKHDVVFTSYSAHEMKVRRVSLETPSLDVTPERLGSFEDHTHHYPIVFDSGDRVFAVGDAEERGGIVRLPRGGTLQPVEWFGVKQMRFLDSPIRSEGHVAFVNIDEDVVEVDPKGARVVGRIEFGDKISYNVEKKCWQADAIRREPRLLCAAP
ncbi:hypothetical protein [Polyangium sp. y55x31]|uniref:hypothetical protein n=1 Tax=Polyangium sp. y55x31 TaxID=3042688 RepID=UPI0024827427|nr:hypothetical protein [Polyangium sp. y55x31]MDI1483907.1 hypothetical protein [Polyangium sp. y55x31]